MKPRLHLKPKNKVRVRASVRLVVAGAVFATLVAVGFLVYYNFGTSTDTWAFNESRFSGYAWRKKISFDKTILQGNETLYNFPLLIEVKDPDLKHISRGGKMVHLKGGDIRFSKADGETVLISQIEHYNPESGRLLAWVLLDTLSAKSASSIYLYFSRADIPPSNNSLFWEGSYQAIWHFSNSLQADNSRRIRATMMGTSEANGVVGNGRNFSAANSDCAQFPWLQELDLKADISVSAWVQLHSINRHQVILSNQGDQPGGYRLYIDKNNKVAFDFINLAGMHLGTESSPGGQELENGQWYHIAAVYSLDDKTIRTYLNGQLDKVAVVNDSPAPTPAALQMGRDQFVADTYLDGTIDEVRLSKMVKSSTWLLTEYYTMKMAGSLFRMGPSEALQMHASAVKSNKEAMNLLSRTEAEQQEAVNQLQAKKNSGTAPTLIPMSENNDVIKARLENIRRVSKDNAKAE